MECLQALRGAPHSGLAKGVGKALQSPVPRTQVIVFICLFRLKKFAPKSMDRGRPARLGGAGFAKAVAP
jgi:hypothetical protein